jgi:hypothetical protein
MSWNNPPEGGFGLWYDPKVNRFFDDDGNVQHDLYEFFDLWKLDEWKKTKRYGTITDRDGMVWDLYYPDTHPEEVCDHNCNLCGSKCEIYQFLREWEQEQNYIQIRKEVFG